MRALWSVRVAAVRGVMAGQVSAQPVVLACDRFDHRNSRSGLMDSRRIPNITGFAFLEGETTRGSALLALLFFAVLTFAPRAAAAQGDPLRSEFRVNTFTTNAQRTPVVAADPSGNFVVVWTSFAQDGSDYGIFAQRYDSGGTPQGPEFRVNTFTTNRQFATSVAADPSGNFVVVWFSDTQDGSNYGVFGQRYASSGIPLGLEFRVNTYTTDSQRTPSIAADSSGNFVVVWPSYTQDGSSFGVFGQRYDGFGAPQGPEFRVNTYTTNVQGFPSVAADSLGNFVVVWESDTQDGSNYGIFGQRYDGFGSPLGPEFRVNTFTSSFQERPSVAADSSGNFIVVWESDTQDGSNYGVFGQRYASSGTPLGPEFRVNTYTTGNQFFPSVASDSSGNFVVIWASYMQDGSSYGVFGQRYDSVGTPQGPDFRVNTYTTNAQYAIRSVASDSSGNFVVLWQSNTQDGSNFGVFGQRYNMIVPVELMHFRVE